MCGRERKREGERESMGCKGEREGHDERRGQTKGKRRGRQETDDAREGRGRERGPVRGGME